MRRLASMLLSCHLSLPSRKAAPQLHCHSRRPIFLPDRLRRTSLPHTQTMTPVMILGHIIPAVKCYLTHSSAAMEHRRLLTWEVSKPTQWQVGLHLRRVLGRRSPSEARRPATTRMYDGDRR